jgi:hypothetical protein
MKTFLLATVAVLALFSAASAVEPTPPPGEETVNNPRPRGPSWQPYYVPPRPSPYVRPSPYYPHPNVPYYVVVPGRGGYWVYPSYPRPYYPAPYPYYPRPYPYGPKYPRL